MFTQLFHNVFNDISEDFIFFSKKCDIQGLKRLSREIDMAFDDMKG